jgi:hypothetical protein
MIWVLAEEKKMKKCCKLLLFLTIKKIVYGVFSYEDEDEEERLWSFQRRRKGVTK